MIYGSLFSGIGGTDLGLERAGLECAWQVELDPWRRYFLELHFPGVPKYEDVRKVGTELASVDLIVGGFPCQDVSQAGTRTEGIRGSRSGLWTEMARVVALLRPEYVLVENVTGLSSQGIDVVLGSLAASGYDAQWTCLGAAHFGAPHLRRRVFILANRPGSPNPLQLAVRDAGRRIGKVGDRDQRRREEEWWTPRESGLEGEPGSKLDGPGLPKWPPPPGDLRAWERVRPLAQPAFCGLADGLPLDLADFDRWASALAAFGDSAVPEICEWIGRWLIRARTESSR